MKYHFKTDQGIEFLTQEDGDRLAGEDGDYHQRDLYERDRAAATSRAGRCKMQIMPFEEAKTYRFNPFDLTKVWPHGDYPLHEVGRMTLDRNVDRLPHRDRAGRLRAEQPRPGHRAEPGQDAAGARVLLQPTPTGPGSGSTTSRSRSTRRRRRCTATARTAPCGSSNVTDPVYAPNSKGGPQADPERVPPKCTGPPTATWSACRLHPARGRRRLGPGRHAGPRGLDDAARERLVAQRDRCTSKGVRSRCCQRAFEYWRNIDPDLGKAIEEGVRANLDQ